MEASIIVPTYNGAHKIPNLLDSLVKQTVKDFEVIIVIDGSTDNTQQVIEPYKKVFPNFKTLFQANKGRSSARNMGASHAQAEILIFYDDDMLPYPDSIARHLDFHANNSGCLLGGSQFEIDSKSNSDIQNYKAFLSRKWIKKYHEGLNELALQNLFFSTANCSMSKKQFQVLNGFDERLTDAEDFDFSLRALERGVKVYFDKSNDAIHHDPISCTGYIKRLREYSVAKKEVYRLHQNLSFSDRLELSYWRKAFYFPFATFIFPKIVDRFNIFLILPRRIRYKFYDVMMHSLSQVYTNKRL